MIVDVPADMADLKQMYREADALFLVLEKGQDRDIDQCVLKYPIWRSTVDQWRLIGRRFGICAMPVRGKLRGKRGSIEGRLHCFDEEQILFDLTRIGLQKLSEFRANGLFLAIVSDGMRMELERVIRQGSHPAGHA